LLGQLVAMSVIDHYGLFGSKQFDISYQRIAGLVLMALGVLTVLAKPS